MIFVPTTLALTMLPTSLQLRTKLYFVLAKEAVGRRVINVKCRQLIGLCTANNLCGCIHAVHVTLLSVILMVRFRLDITDIVVHADANKYAYSAIRRAHRTSANRIIAELLKACSGEFAQFPIGKLFWYREPPP